MSEFDDRNFRSKVESAVTLNSQTHQVPGSEKNPLGLKPLITNAMKEEVAK
jgi:hypothetical protein